MSIFTTLQSFGILNSENVVQEAMYPNIKIFDNVVQAEFPDSSLIKELVYDNISNQLSIQFKSNPNKVYVYYPVDGDLAGEMIASDSVGKFFHKYIKNNPDISYTEHEITEEPKDDAVNVMMELGAKHLLEDTGGLVKK